MVSVWYLPRTLSFCPKRFIALADLLVECKPSGLVLFCPLMNYQIGWYEIKLFCHANKSEIVTPNNWAF